MGLYMYAYVTQEKIPAIKFDRPEDSLQVCYWRQHPNLHGWMQELYQSKGGDDEDFNLCPLRLDEADIDALEVAINADNPRDVGFIRLARQAIRSGKRVYYYSHLWW